MSSLVSAIGEGLGISKNSIRGLATFISDVRECTWPVAGLNMLLKLMYHGQLDLVARRSVWVIMPPSREFMQTFHFYK